MEKSWTERKSVNSTVKNGKAKSSNKKKSRNFQKYKICIFNYRMNNYRLIGELMKFKGENGNAGLIPSADKGVDGVVGK